MADVTSAWNHSVIWDDSALWNDSVPEEYIEQVWEQYHADFCETDCMCKEEVN